ncbi:MAG: L,D-transpeptidase [Candidatus Dormibacteraeota bacterium]|nr:L,D-transpeptidase [Candidatus Dormibacteraeota bacterium]
MKRSRGAILAIVVVALVAAVPVSAIASDRILRGDVQQAESQFERSLTHAIAGGLNRRQADRLTQRYREVVASRPAAWWLAPVVEREQLDHLSQLRADLETMKARQLADGRTALRRQLDRWNKTLAAAKAADISSVGFEENPARFTSYAALAATPNELAALAAALGDQSTILDGRMAAFRTARSQADAAVQNARSLLATAGQYPQLHLLSFQTRLASAADGLPAVHEAAAFVPLVGVIQDVAAGVQSLLDARTAAYNQLAAAQSSLAAAQSIGASLGNAAAAINAISAQLGTAGDQATLQSLTWQLVQQKQGLAAAISAKQQEPIAYNAGPGKVIVISLSRQVLTAFQDGNVVLTTYVATGRPALPTPPGTYQILHKQTPYTMISPWPTSSPYWYPTSRVSMVMEFLGGGYFIHDAPWRTWYGPGSNLYNGTHGCVNVPFSSMQFLYGWAPMGTTVVVQY